MEPGTHLVIPDGTTEIAPNAFENRQDIVRVTLPGSITNIGPSAFQGCLNLTEINIPPSVTSVCTHAFYDCWALRTIDLPDCTLGDGVFCQCRSLESIRFPASLRSIQQYTCSGCKSLVRIQFPTKLEYIFGFAFYGCRSITHIVFPDTVSVIGWCAFSVCDALRVVRLSSKLEQFVLGVGFSRTAVTTIIFPEVAPVIEIDCPSLVSIVLPTKWSGLDPAKHPRLQMVVGGSGLPRTDRNILDAYRRTFWPYTRPPQRIQDKIVALMHSRCLHRELIDMALSSVHLDPRVNLL